MTKTDKEKNAEVENKEKGNPLPIIIVALIMMAIVAGIGVYKKQHPTVSENGKIPEKQKAVDLAQMQRHLGPEWQMIKMVRGKWYGPYKMKNGSDWRVAKGKIWVKVDNNRSFLDYPNTDPIVSGRQIKFLSATDTAIVFFRY